ncbi:cell adhesion molecule Dscam2-like isoform X1 [Eriocheir sinensis]|uniref:cell adhesion molecule Dscam2-like isoform X1 n=1 Tax=Eriocheir sinensis TaxID=95602 RepID=UPI0021CA8CBD|nr:cell adhesion molecule Dscam2-like isoform X1 [Eriocheir sinensis]XP_050729972.1 cell adhesion molecule Dscam2-like isoform X1 [Eriocheir sinensis]
MELSRPHHHHHHHRRKPPPPPSPLLSSPRVFITTPSSPPPPPPPSRVFRMHRCLQLHHLHLLLHLLLLLLVFVQKGVSAGRVTQGPSFTVEPPRHLHFTNSSGAVLDCVAEGVPAPTLTWTTKDGRQVEQVEGLREIAVNGSLIFPPFPSQRYEEQVHDQTYTCRASSPAGTLLATPTQLRAVVVGHYEVQVYDQVVMTGNTAVLRCAVPLFVQDYVTVTSWVHDGSFNIYPSMHGDGKYHMTADGELHVLDVGPPDGLSRFQCRTLHKLTRRTQLSHTPARIIITEPQGTVPPKIRETTRRVVAEEGARVTLPCVAQAHPPPTYTWYKGATALTGSSGVWTVGGSLVLGRVGVGDAGEYSCVVNNTAGHTKYSAHLLVTHPLSVQVTPREVQVDAGGRLELRCHVSGTPVDSVTWLKDGNMLSRRSNDRVRIRPRESLHLAPVDISDTGIYQCVAIYGRDYAHAPAYVTLGAAAPQLVYRFIEQTIKPGPSVSLKCIATGTPTPHITWQLDGFPIPHSHRYVKGQYVSAHGDVVSHVNISSVHVTDGGSYTCAAENSAGRVQHSARLNVYGPPHVRPMGAVSAVAGQTFSVTCPASGYPIHKITWSKDGVRLPTSHRQRVHANGTLVVEQVTRDSDKGEYACTASNRAGRQDTQKLNVRVMVPPRLAQLVFPEETRAGMRAQASCFVQEGDQPLTLTWRKDGRPLDPRLEVRVSTIDPYTSILVIDRAAAAHTGNYSCVVANAARTATTSARLTVSVPPAWVVEPASTNVALGGSVALHCLAKGFPNPAVAWSKETVSGEFVGVATGEGGVSGWENGTLMVSHAERRHEGRYLCAANNGVGSGLSKVVALSVNEPPWFSVRSQRQQVVVGGSVTLSCEAHGDAPLTVTWTRGGAPLPTLPRYGVSERGTDGGQVSELTLRATHITDTGTYTCTATNDHGSLASDFVLLVQDVPGPPSGLAVGEEGSRHLTLSWMPPEDSNAPITAYIITFDAQHSLMVGGPREVTVDGDQKRVRLESLQPATTYTLAVVAENRVGRSQPSPPLTAATHEEAPTGHPQNVVVVPVSSTALQVTWEPPPENLTHGTILGYYLGFKDDSEGETGAYNFTTVGVDGAGVTTASLSGLRPHASYSVVLQAFNSRGAGPGSPPALATTMEDKPSAPPGHVTCESVTSTTLEVTWSPPPPRARNGLITTYKLSYVHHPLHGGGDGGGSIMRKGQRATLDTLTPFTNYSVSVAAFTKAGQGVSSPAVMCTTDQDVPEAPARVKAVVSGPRAAVVSWGRPSRPHGTITRYTVHWQPAGGRGGPHSRRVEPHLTHLSLHDLSHTTYKVWVTASTKMGEGPPSPGTLVKPSHTVPAGVWSVGGNLTAAWKEDVSLACGAVGVPEPSLTWTHLRNVISDKHERFKIQPDGTLTLADIQRTDSGEYVCTATNNHGVDTVTYNLTVLVPPSAPSLHVTETTASSIRVQWSVEDTGGAPLQGATLHYRSAGGEWVTQKVGGEHRSYTATGLRCGTLHHFYLTGHNYIGTSSASRTEAARTKGRPPEAPPQFQFVTTNSSQATLYLAQWGDGGCPITHFSVQYRKADSRHWTTVGSEVSPARTYAVGGLEPGVRYELRVTAHNAAGATPERYTLITPGLGLAGMGVGTGGMGWGGTPSAAPVWRDPRVLVPAAVSALALLLTVTTVCVCIRKRPQSSGGGGPEGGGGDNLTGGDEDKSALQAREEQQQQQGGQYTTVRRPAPTPPQHHHHPHPHHPQHHPGDTTGDYSEEELYPYATATFQLSGGSPPPPAPPSPPSHAHHPQPTRAQKAFTALVYQAPSLHDVDSPNLSERERDVGRGGVRGFTYEASETEDYGSVLGAAAPAPPPDPRCPPHHRRPPRHLRTSRTPRCARFP